MTYRLRIHPRLEDDFAAIPPTLQTRIRAAIRSLADDPRPAGAKKLVGIPNVKNAYRLRVGSYRVGYRICDRELVVAVVAAAERGRIYRIFTRRAK